MALTEQTLKELLQQNSINIESLKILSDIGSEQIYGLTVSGGEAIALWHQLHALTQQTGHYPVLMGSKTDIQLEAIGFYQQYAEQQENPHTAEHIIEKGLTLDAEEWFATQTKEFGADGDEWDEEFPEEWAEFAQATPGAWPDAITPNQEFTIPLDIRTLIPLDHVIVALVPTPIGWQVPAFLRFGAWNACPHPEVHVALMKRWHELYGAEVVGITYDTVEMLVTRPPGDRDTARQLAKEQYLYCSDIVDQGVQTLERLAVTLLNGTVWYFWWD